jgi:hypothetical protein
MLSEKLCEVPGVLFRISHIVLRTTLHNNFVTFGAERMVPR